MMHDEEVIDDLLDQVARLKAERDALLADAERYRWLRDGGIALLPYNDHGMGPEFNLTDAALDAARSK